MREFLHKGPKILKTILPTALNMGMRYDSCKLMTVSICFHVNLSWTASLTIAKKVNLTENFVRVTRNDMQVFEVKRSSRHNFSELHPLSDADKFAFFHACLSVLLIGAILRDILWFIRIIYNQNSLSLVVYIRSTRIIIWFESCGMRHLPGWLETLGE